MSKIFNITLPKEKLLKNFESETLTLLVNKIRSREVSLITLHLKLFNHEEEEVSEYSSTNPFIITPVTNSISYTFNNIDKLDNIRYYQIILRGEGLHKDNPLYFSELMLNEGETVPYKKPHDEVGETNVGFINNFYTLYHFNGLKGNLQIIRPNYDKLTTKNLLKSKCTVLAPHLDNDLEPDYHENIGLEYMNMKDQTIELVR